MSTDTMSLSAEPPRDHVDAVARLADACAAAARTALAGLPAWLRFHDDLDVEWDVPEHEVNAAFIEERRLALPNRAAPLPADEKAEVAAATLVAKMRTSRTA